MYKPNLTNRDYYCAKNPRTMDIDTAIYNKLAENLTEEIGNSNYFNGSISIESGSYTFTLRTTLIIYREADNYCTEAKTMHPRISDIIPVWWEFHAYSMHGEDSTDFSWREFKEYILQY